MKKLLLATVIAMFSLTGLKAQSTGFGAEVFGGIPMGDVKDAYSFNFGLNLNYYWTVSDNFQAGVAAGYDYWSGKEIDAGILGKFKIDAAGFMPIAASAKYNFDGFFVGADLGYGIGVSKGNEGGFYYRPRVGYNFSSFNVGLFYKGISMNGGSFSSLGLGFGYNF